MTPAPWRALMCAAALAACGDNASPSAVDATLPPDAAAPISVSGTVSGLAGTGLVLQVNGAHDLAVTTNGAFHFSAQVPFGTAYAVTVASQPVGPSQICSITGGSGTAGATDVTDIAITCATQSFAVHGTVSGLLGAGLVLQNNGGDPVAVAADGSFAFPSAIASGDAFAVTVQTQPTGPSQTCDVAGGAGTIGAGDVTTVVVSCATDHFAVGGQVSGLLGTLVLENNGSDDATITANGAFAFPTTIASGGAYAVTIKTQPGQPSQTCTITTGTDAGTVTDAAITSVAITCVTNTFTIGGTVTGLAGAGLVLQDNAGDDLAIGSDGAFTFATPVASGAVYAVTASVQPTGPAQICTVTHDTGTVGAANVTDVAVTCVTTQRALTVALAGSGAGGVSSNPTGIDCGSACGASFDDGTAVTLTATPTAGSVFSGWSGGGCSGTGACVVTMTADTTVTATFDPGPLMDTSPDEVVFDDQRCDGAISLAITAHVATHISALQTHIEPLTATRIKFVIFDQAASTVVFASDPIDVSAGLQFVTSPPMSFDMIVDKRYHFAAMVEGCANFPWGFTAATVNGIETFGANGNPTNFANPTGPDECCSVVPRFEIFGSQP